MSAINTHISVSRMVQVSTTSSAVSDIDKQIAKLKETLKDLQDQLAQVGQSDTLSAEDKKKATELIKAEIKLVQLQIEQLEKKKEEIKEAQENKRKTPEEKAQDSLNKLMKIDNPLDIYV